MEFELDSVTNYKLFTIYLFFRFDDKKYRKSLVSKVLYTCRKF